MCPQRPVSHPMPSTGTCHVTFNLSAQGIEDKFLEQWHQKLHTNTTPADITICEAYIAFLHSGDGGHFWHALWEKGGLTREALATMDHPITGLTHSLDYILMPAITAIWMFDIFQATCQCQVHVRHGP